MKSSKPIGIFDSGVGGISVLKRIRDELPNEDLLYLADSAYAPYGNKSESFIEDRSIFLTRFLVNLDVKAVVVACNTATASAISKIRSMFGLPIIGMEPAVKPAVAATRSGVVGILATEGTLNSTKFSILKQRFGKGTRLITQPCPGLVEQVEQGDFSESLTRDLVESYVSPLVKQNVDIIVLGCTHYPFLSEIIEEVAGPGIKIIDTGVPVAKELCRRLKKVRLVNDSKRAGAEQFWSSGNQSESQGVISRLWKKSVEVNGLPR